MSKKLFSLVGWGMLVVFAFGVALARPSGQGAEVSVYLPFLPKSDSPITPSTVTATATSTATAATPTSTSTMTSATPTPTSTSTSTTTLTPTATMAALERLNYYRALAFLPPVTEDANWSLGDYYHARYCVKNNVVSRLESLTNPWYTAEGAEAGANGNVFGSTVVTYTDWAAIDSWMIGPFHALKMINPRLAQSGFGSYREADGGLQMAAVLDITRGLGSVPPSVTFPVIWPADNTTVFLTRYTGGESPDPLASCGYMVPSGLPVIMQLGAGGLTPNVIGHSVKQGGADVQSCIFTETTYTNSDPGQQTSGRSTLNQQDAIVIIPREPLIPGVEYTFAVTTTNHVYTWSFNVAPNAPVNLLSQDAAWMR